MDMFRSITWKEERTNLQELFGQSEILEVSPLPSGLEADVYKVAADDKAFVLKIWNRNSRPNVALQYSILEQLHQQGISVSRPYGWGEDQDGHQVLLTSFDGQPVQKLNAAKLQVLAKVQTDIHKVKSDYLDRFSLPRYDFVLYFFPTIEEHADIRALLMELLHRIELNSSSLIHGDFNLGNVLESDDGKLTIIDWTNVQAGDVRYDIAWSVILMRIYVNDRLADRYRSALLRINPITDGEYEVFEAIACLRWMLLERLAYLSHNSHTRASLTAILRSNRYLDEGLLYDKKD